MAPDYYKAIAPSHEKAQQQVLGVPVNAAEAEIKKACQSIAHQLGSYLIFVETF